MCDNAKDDTSFFETLFKYLVEKKVPRKTDSWRTLTVSNTVLCSLNRAKGPRTVDYVV